MSIDQSVWPYIERITERYEKMGYKLDFAVVAGLALLEMERDSAPESTE